MGIFRRKKKIDIDTVYHSAPHFLPGGEYEMSWERQRQPDPGAMSYSWETLGLPEFSPIGPGRGVISAIGLKQPTQVWYQSIPVAGMPTVSGQIVLQPLIRNGGYA